MMYKLYNMSFWLMFVLMGLSMLLADYNKVTCLLLFICTAWAMYDRGRRDERTDEIKRTIDKLIESGGSRNEKR